MLTLRVFLTFCILIICTRTAIAQKSTKPSQHRFETDNHRDTLLINQLLRLGNDLMPRFPDSAAVIYYTALSRSMATGYTEATGKIYNNLSLCYREKDVSKSASFLRHSITIHEQLNKKDLLRQQYITLANLYETSGDINQIKTIYPQAQYLYLTTNPHQKNQLCMLRNNMGRMFFLLGQYDSASFYYGRVLLDCIVPDTENYRTIVRAESATGVIQARLGQFTKCLDHLHKAEALAWQFADTNLAIAQVSNAGVLLYEQGDYERAKATFIRILKPARKAGSPYLPQITSMLATVLSYQDSFRKAMPYAIMGYEYAMESRQSDNIIPACYTIGLVTLHLKQYQSSVQYLLYGLKMAANNGKTENMGNAYLLLSEAYAGMHQYKKAILYKDRYIRMTDSLKSKEIAERVTHVEMQYKTASKDRLLTEQKLLINSKESKIREKNVWIGCIGVIALLLFLLAANRFRNKQKLQQQQAQINNLNARMQGEEIERGRIAKELHDGVSVLISAAKMHYSALGKQHEAIADTETYQEVMQLLNQSSSEVRTISYNLVPELLLQQSLPAAVQAFCDLIKKGHQLSVSLQVYGPYIFLDQHWVYAVYRIIQELVQNIVKHAEASTVLLQMLVHNNALYLTIEDNGKGFVIHKHTAGMGIRNVNNRVQSLKGTWACHSKPSVGTTFDIEIPLPPST